MTRLLRRKCWKRGKESPPVTVSWSLEGVSILLWGQSPGKGLICTGSVTLEAGDCAAETYAERLRVLVGAKTAEAVVTDWILVQPSPRTYSSRDGEAGVFTADQFPEWMRSCWEELPDQCLPRGVYSGLDCMELELLKWSLFRESGTGIYFPLHGRGFFFGYAKDGLFSRVSRTLDPGAGKSTGLEEEWLQQTRMLYRNRTGLELKKVILPGGEKTPLRTKGEGAVEILSATPPVSWISTQAGNVDPSLVFLHASARRSGQASGCARELDLLSARRSNRRIESILKTGVVLLLGGWTFLLQGACSNATVPDAVASNAATAWKAEIHTWRAHERKYREAATLERIRETPYRLVSSVSQSIPEGVNLRRIQVNRVGTGNPDELQLVVEGQYAGEHPSTVFREWMATLKKGGPLSQVENLRFKPDEEGILFTLEGLAIPERGTP